MLKLIRIYVKLYKIHKYDTRVKWSRVSCLHEKV